MRLVGQFVIVVDLINELQSCTLVDACCKDKDSYKVGANNLPKELRVDEFVANYCKKRRSQEDDGR